jgi:hypothetical protein
MWWLGAAILLLGVLGVAALVRHLPPPDAGDFE